jgi:Uma2 family endonuclease
MSSVLVEAAYHKELIDGHEVEKPLPKKLHARVQAYLIRVLAMTIPQSYEALPELNVLCGGDRLVPDITVTERSARYEDGDLADAPALAVEIMSPGQTLSDLVDRCERLHKAGAAQCWIIWPERRQAWMFTPVSLEAAKENLTASFGEDSIEINLAEMWSELD